MPEPIKAAAPPPPPQASASTAAPVSLLLSNPYSNNAAGVFPSSWNRQFDSKDGRDGYQRMLYAVTDLTPAEATKIQKAMWLAGYYPGEDVRARRQPRWGTFSESDRLAWQKFVEDVVVYQGYTNDPATGALVKSGRTNRTADELLNERIQQFAGVHQQALAEGAGSIEDSFIKTIDPATVAVNVRAQAQQLLGRDLNPGEVDAIVPFIVAADTANKTSAAQLQVDYHRRGLMAQAGYAEDGTGGMAMPSVVTDISGGGSGITLANALSERFAVNITKGQVTPAQNQGGDPKFESGLAFTFTGNQAQMDALRKYLDGQNVNGQLVEKIDVTNPVIPEVKTTREVPGTDLRKQAEDEARAELQNQALTPEGMTGGQIAALTGPNTRENQAARDLYNEQLHVTTDSKYAEKLGVKTFQVKQGNQTMPPGLVLLPGTKTVYVPADEAARVSQPAAATTITDTTPARPDPSKVETVTVHFREGAGMPALDNLGFGSRADQYRKFLDAINQPGNATATGIPFNMGPVTYQAVAGELGIKGDDKSADASTRVARRYAERLFNKYGDWDKVTMAWSSGESAVDSWIRQGRDLSKDVQDETKRRLDGVRLAMSGGTLAAPIDAQFDQMYGGQTATGAVSGGNIVTMPGYDPAAQAQLMLEDQHSAEAQGYGAADAFSKFASLMAGPVRGLGD